MAEKRIKEIYNAREKENYWQEFWENENINNFDPDSAKEVFTIDTPPPTISGALHLGHVFSYTQAEVIARYRRLAGFNVRYPMGYDNNGLPTERLAEKERGIRGNRMPLAEFVKICLEMTDTHKIQYESLWKSLGLSIDWRLEYSTISAEAQKLAQTVFKELFEQGAIYQKEATALYCTTCRTSVAQAEVEDEEVASVFYDIAFQEADGKELIISTTRPELLPACAAVFIHPQDERYAKLSGKNILTPLGKSVPVLTDEKVSIEKGTGAVMCCTYGDETDVYWTRQHKLPEKIILTREGKFIPLEELPEIAGQSVTEARRIIVEKLRAAGAIKKEQPISHAVGVHERCSTPIELLPTKQWFVKILDKKADLLQAGLQIRWYPAHMRKRYEEWVSGLKWDWCISRERFFGVPIPVYICDSCHAVVIPEKEKFPIDPKMQTEKLSCPQCDHGNLVPEKSVLDTWFTSSLTPDINNDLPLNGKLAGKMYPLSMRPQAHDIIRTWVVYSVLMGLYRHHNVPWRELMISGHVLLRKGEKISKKNGSGAIKPEEIIRTHSADAIRYTVYGSALGRDAYYDEQEVKKGKKLINKIYNAGKLILGNLADFTLGSVKNENELEVIDRWILARARAAAAEMAKEFDQYEYNHARQIFEKFFWNDLCDNYLEIIKGRLWNTEGLRSAQRTSAQYALYHVYLATLTLISPFLPHIAEEMYHAELSAEGALTSRTDTGFFATKTGLKSIHLASWPKSENINLLSADETAGVDLMLQTITAIRKYKTSQQLTMGAPLPPIALQGTAEQKKLLTPFWSDLTFIARAEEISFRDATSPANEDRTVIAL